MAANAAVAFSYQDLQQTWGSSVQLMANLAGIVLAGTLTLLVQRALWAWQRRRDPAVRPGPSGIRGSVSRERT